MLMTDLARPGGLFAILSHMLDRWLPAIVSAACVLLAGACGGAASAAAPSTPAGAPRAADPVAPGSGPAPRAAASVSLTVTSPGAPTARVTCAGSRSTATGFLRLRAVAACAASRRLAHWLASRPNRTVPCPQIYGGPQEARVAGRIGGVPIVRSFSRRDGCQIADWNRAQALLPRLPASPSG